MSRRTSAANKAITKAWENEQNYVLEGKGTREWSPEQQQDILNKGKAYDENGRAFEGQHMKSVGEYPEYQGEPGNIQFLTREEHLDAHLGSWQNPTNWYYNPVTKERTDFGNNSFIPCKVFELDNPIVNIEKDDDNCNVVDAKDNNKRSIDEDIKIPSGSYKQECSTTRRISRRTHVSSSRKARNTFSKIGGFINRNRGAIKTGGKVAAGIAIKILWDKATGKNGGYGGGFSYDGTDTCSLLVDRGAFDRLSPREHSVSGYTRKQNGKEVHVRPYKRGGNKS